MKRKSLLLVVVGIWLWLPGARANETAVDSLLAVLPTLSDDLALSRTYYAIAYHQLDDTETAIEYSRKAFAHAQEAGNVEQLAKAGFMFGVLSDELKHKKDAFIGYYKSLESYRSLENDIYSAKCHQAIGRLYLYAHQPEKARDHFSEASAYLSGKPDEQRVSLYLDLADLYYEEEDYESALSYYQIAKELATTPEKMVYTGIWMGNLFLNTEEYDKALASYQYAEEAVRGTELEDLNMGIISYNRGEVAFYQDDMDKAMELYAKALDYRGESTDYFVACYLNGVARVHIANGNYSEALATLDESLQIGEGMRDKEQYLLSFELAIEAAKDADDLATAFGMQQKYQSLLVSEQEAETALSDARAGLEIQLAENEILAAELAAANRLRIFLIAISSGLGLVVLIMLLLRVYNRHQRLRNKYDRKQAAIKELKRMAVNPEW